MNLILKIGALVLVIGVGLYLFLRVKKKKTDEYIWVGPGENPFKEKD